MRVVFAGTPDFARLALEAILQAGHEVPLVLTQPDRPSGRGMKLRASPVKDCAQAHQIEVLQPTGLRLDGRYAEEALATQQRLAALKPDVMVVAAYGLILPEWVLSLPKYGCLNIHASLLPRWRGAAPIQRAIDAGDTETGITIMQMDAGLDTGDMLLRQRLPIHTTHTAGSLHDELADLGAQAIIQALDQLAQGTLVATPQPEQGVTYADKLHKDEAALDFNLGAEALARRIRAFNPVPGTTMMLPGLEQPVKVWAAHAVAQPADAYAPGQVMHVRTDGIDVATNDGILCLTELQRPGSRRQPVAQFVQGWQPL